MELVPRSEPTLRVGHTNRSVNAVEGNNRCLFSDPHKTHKLCGQNVEFMNDQPGGTYSDQWALKGSLYVRL